MSSLDCDMNKSSTPIQMPLTLATTVTLSNGVAIPLLGYGTSHHGGFSHAAFRFAVMETGLTLIDTARRYGTERLIGPALKKIGIDRKKLFITTKVWPADYGYEAALKSITASLNDLDTSYVDLLLMHWPDCPSWCTDKRAMRADTWRAFEEAYAAGRCRAIGVSNFDIPFLEELLESSTVSPQVNQVEFHPYCQPAELIDFCRQKKIFVQGYGPLAKGAIITDDRLKEPIKIIADKHRKTLAQVAIRWCLQRGIGCIPKSTKEERITENANVFDFKLDDGDMKAIDRLADDAYFKSTWEPKTLYRYQEVVSQKTDMLYQVEELDTPDE